MSEQDDGVTVSHIAVRVSDLDRAARFYTQALGFTPEFYVDIGAPFDVLTQAPGLKGRAGFFNKGAVRLELATFETPEPPPTGTPATFLRIGLTHLSFVIKDIDAVARRIEEYGGRVLDHTRIDGGKGPMVFAHDPDGTPLELWQRED
jgi:catechol 2,3-dioxygenase-like lactoylglutathione lyase family enzyme